VIDGYSYHVVEGTGSTTAVGTSKLVRLKYIPPVTQPTWANLMLGGATVISRYSNPTIDSVNTNLRQTSFVNYGTRCGHYLWAPDNPAPVGPCPHSTYYDGTYFYLWGRGNTDHGWLVQYKTGTEVVAPSYWTAVDGVVLELQVVEAAVNGFLVKRADGSVSMSTSAMGAMLGGTLVVAPSESGVFRGDGLGDNPNWYGLKLHPLEYQSTNAQGNVNYTQHNMIVEYCEIINGTETCFLEKLSTRYPKLTYNQGIAELEFTTSSVSTSNILLFLGGE
jgi:hypothetical protein